VVKLLARREEHPVEKSEDDMKKIEAHRKPVPPLLA
jgi:hypothetical protein